MPDYSPDELDQLITYHLEHELDRGTVIRNLGAWRASTRQQCLENEKLLPGYITRSVLAITARKDGKRLTYCSESRGTHAISYIYDPRGTTTPPAWWNRDAAKAEHDAQRNPPARTAAISAIVGRIVQEHAPTLKLLAQDDGIKESA